MIFQVALVVQNSPAKAGDARDLGSISGSGRSGGRHGIPFQYSCLENYMDREAWQVTVHRVTESDTTMARTLSARDSLTLALTLMPQKSPGAPP